MRRTGITIGRERGPRLGTGGTKSVHVTGDSSSIPLVKEQRGLQRLIVLELPSIPPFIYGLEIHKVVNGRLTVLFMTRSTKGGYRTPFGDFRKGMHERLLFACRLGYVMGDLTDLSGRTSRYQKAQFVTFSKRVR